MGLGPPRSRRFFLHSPGLGSVFRADAGAFLYPSRPVLRRFFERKRWDFQSRTPWRGALDLLGGGTFQHLLTSVSRGQNAGNAPLAMPFVSGAEGFQAGLRASVAQLSRFKTLPFPITFRLSP